MRYVVLCPPRSGSTLLMSALGAHPGAAHCMEPFNPDLAGDAPHDVWRRDAVAALFGPKDAWFDAAGYFDGARQPLETLAAAVFERFAGAKILWDQVRAASPVWDVLAALPDLRVIVLHRNPVDCAASFRAALDSNVWHVPAGAAAPAPEPLRFEPGYFSWFFDWFCAPERPIRARLANRPQLEVAYERLVADWAAEIARIRDFLGLQGPTPPMAFERLGSGSLRDRIPDLETIAAAYADHPDLAAAFADVIRRPA